MFLINKMEQIGQYDHSNNYSKEDDYKVSDTQPFEMSQLNISQQQMTYVTHSEAGEGLIFYGNVILPFIDRFPQDTELYRVMTTKPGEVSA